MLRSTDPRIEADKFKTPAVECDEGGELSVGIDRVWPWYDGRVKLGGALALAVAASPNKVGGVVLASTELMLFLDELIT